MPEIDHTADAERADYYAALGVSPTSSPDEIAQAYHHLARQYHPDLHPGDAEADQRFKAINSAYQTLSNPERRAKYDQQRLQPSVAPTGDDGPQVITFERSIDLQNTDIQAAVDELGAAVADMAAETANELRDALRDFGMEVDTLMRSAAGADGNGNRAQRRAAPRHDRRPPPRGPDPQRPPYNGEPPQR